jgi:hypothetical protein
LDNLPGLPAISYRVGTWATFKESMLAKLSSAEYPALAGLKTRADDDFTIALLDASAMVLDILTFYQERLANESYLRTAQQLRSLVELSRLIGYQPAPGVSASTYLAFTLKESPGQAPDPTNPAITIANGTQVQSVPVQGQTPQTFETSADIPAKADWNALPVQTGQAWQPGTSGLYLSGVTTRLQLGDVLLILGVERETWDPNSTTNPSEKWDVVVINQILVDSVRNLTYVDWAAPLTHFSGVKATQWSIAKVFAFRQKAAQFGNNAPSAALFAKPDGNPTFPGMINIGVSPWEWLEFAIQCNDKIDLDALYRSIVPNGWFVLRVNDTVLLLKVVQATAVQRSDFTLNAKVTELVPDYVASGDDLSNTFDLRGTEVWVQSEELTVAEQPLDHPLYGNIIDLKYFRSDLVAAQAVAITGKRQKLQVAAGITTLQFIPDAVGSEALALKPGDLLTLVSVTPVVSNPDDWASYPDPVTLRVEDIQARPGRVGDTLLSNPSLVLIGKLELAPSTSKDVDVGEYALVATVASAPGPRTRFTLQASLTNYYDRATTTVNVNVAPATQGQTANEVLGSGNAATANQSFPLSHKPLTFVSAPTPSGRQSTLQVRANGVAWTEVPSLNGQDPAAQVFSTLIQADGTTTVLFGDRVEGATLPTGQHNIQANYRFGLGAAGNVGADKLTTLLDRPLGVSDVTNPEPATGGQDPETTASIRCNAPQTVLTLGRAVSITDYQNFAATFAGIAKAYAVWIPSGASRGVFLTVAGVGGAALPDDDPSIAHLVTALKNFGNPLIPITVRSFLETLFGISAQVKYDPAYDAAVVRNQIVQALYGSFSFAQRTFGQGVSIDEVASVMQAVSGVVAVNVTQLQTNATSAGGDLAGRPGGFTLSNYSNWLASQPASGQSPAPRRCSDQLRRLAPHLPVANDAMPLPAEILVLDPNPNAIVLGVMP